MRAPLQVRFEKLQRLIERVSYEAEQGRIIVVEGAKDRESLRRMGVTGRILCLKGGRNNITGFAEGLSGEKGVIVLTDFDREGVFLAKRLSRVLTSLSIQANLLLWRELRSLTRSDLRSVEELPGFYERLHAELSFRRSPSEPRHRS